MNQYHTWAGARVEWVCVNSVNHWFLLLLFSFMYGTFAVLWLLLEELFRIKCLTYSQLSNTLTNSSPFGVYCRSRFNRSCCWCFYQQNTCIVSTLCSCSYFLLCLFIAVYTSCVWISWRHPVPMGRQSLRQRYFYQGGKVCYISLLIYVNKCKKLQFIHTVNGDGSKTAKIIKRQC